MIHIEDEFGRIVSVAGLIVSAFLLFPSPVHASIARVQSAGATNNATGASIVVAFPDTITAGNLIVAAVTFDSTGGTTWSCSDSLGNTYVKATSVNDVRHSQL